MLEASKGEGGEKWLEMNSRIFGSLCGGPHRSGSNP
jgi:hypothetical protein